MTVGCASPMMQPAARLTNPDPARALVTFLRPSYFGGAITFGIWDSDSFVGVLGAGSYIEYPATPGPHVFLARAENWSYVNAQLEAGKRYYILAKVFPGVWKARIAFDPIRRGDPQTDEEIQNWLKALTPTEPIAEKVDAYTSPRLGQVRQAVGAFRNGEVTYEILEAEDGR